MENTPLELYETAYRLHYVENRVPDALKYYDALIKEFPDSNECGYAAIQIQKIRANTLAKNLRLTSKAHPVAITALLLSILSIFGAAGSAAYFYYRFTIEQQRATLAVKALSKVTRGEDDEALSILTKLKIVDKSDITPFELSADIYSRQGRIVQARSEYDIFYQLNSPAYGQAAKSSSYNDSRQATPPPSTQNSEAEPPSQPISQPQRQTVPSTPTTRPSASRAASAPVPTTKKRTAPNASPKRNSPLLVHPDSISYF